MKLLIDTTNTAKVRVSLISFKKTLDCLEVDNKFGSQILLPLVCKILQKNKVQFTDLDEVLLETGPGSFTGLRVGAAVANSLGFALGIKVNGKNFETELEYN